MQCEYRLALSDGTVGYLSHSGVKGMHWGVWNEETRQKYMGGRFGKKVKADASSAKEKTGKPKIGAAASKTINVNAASQAISAGAATGVTLKRFTGSNIAAVVGGATAAVSTFTISEVTSRHSYKKGLDAVAKLTEKEQIDRARKASDKNFGKSLAGGVALGAVVGGAAYVAGRNAVQAAMAESLTPTLHSVSSHIVEQAHGGNHSWVKPHTHGTSSSAGSIVEQLSNANIPSSLRGTSSKHNLVPKPSVQTHAHIHNSDAAKSIVEQLMNADIPESLRRRI